MDTSLKIVVTSGYPFTDIDALACAIAYSELLKLKGDNAEAVLPGPLNKSVTNKIKKWKLNFSAAPHPPNTNHYSFILVDISEPEYFAKFVNLKNVIEVYDHRKGFENYWKDKLGKNSHIDMVGACATLIWEEFIKVKFDKNISTVSANLLYTAIASNTLNFKASVTTKRDINAFTELRTHTNLGSNWIKTYFLDQDKETEANVRLAIKNDTKNLEPIIGQLELWDSREIIEKNLDDIERVLLSFKKRDWFLTSPCISEGKNYLFTKVPEMKMILERTINAKFKGDIGTTDKLWLRKEIFAKISGLKNSTKN